MKRGLIFNLKPVVEKLMTKEMGLDCALKVIEFGKRFANELTVIEQKRVALVRRYGETREDGNVEVIDEEKKEKFKKAFEKVLSEDVDFDLLDPADFVSLRLTPSEAYTFAPLFNK